MKALVVSMHNNQMERSDAEALSDGLRKADIETTHFCLKDLDKEIDSFPIEEMDFIALWAPFNSVFISTGTAKDTLKKVYNRSRDGVIALIVCDIRQQFAPYLWNKGENSKEDRENVFALKPVTVIGSFNDTILDDPDALKRVSDLWLRKLHPESSFKPMEWLLFHYWSLPQYLEEVSKSSPATDFEINRFYYGLDKTKVAKSLKAMNLGEDPRDAIFGTMGKLFPEVKNLRPEKVEGRKSKNAPELWIPLARDCNELLLPFEPIKGDHQVTKRFLEYACLNPDRITVDTSLNPSLLKYLQKDIWKSRAKSVSEEFRKHIEGVSK